MSTFWIGFLGGIAGGFGFLAIWTLMAFLLGWMAEDW